MSAQQKNNNQDDETVTKNIDFELLCKYKRLKELITMFTSHNQNPAYNFINYVFYYNIKHYIQISQTLFYIYLFLFIINQ